MCSQGELEVFRSVGYLLHTSRLGQPHTKLTQTPHSQFQQQMRIPEQVFILSPQLCAHSAVRDFTRFPFLCLSCSHPELLPILQLSPHRSWVQVMLYSTLFALGNLRLATGIFEISLPFPPSHFCRLPTVVSFFLSPLLFHHHHQSHPNIFVPACLWPFTFGDVFLHLPSASHTSLSPPTLQWYSFGAKKSLRKKQQLFLLSVWAFISLLIRILLINAYRNLICLPC